MPTTATPLLLRDPGYLFWAPLASSLPANTVAGSKFTDAWPGAWLSLGATEEGSAFSYQINLEAISVAEFFDPIAWSTTERSGNFAFALADYTMKNLQRAFNGGTLQVLSGAGATQLTRLTPPAAGGEVRAMIGWESLDSTLRIICYQTINGGELKTEFKKAPAKGLIPCQFQFEVPSAGGQPFEIYGAGAARVGV
jgi:hypothetical protein